MKSETTSGPQVAMKKKIKSVVDPELGINTKKELSYYLNLPDNYSANKKYPLIIVIDGWGGHPTSKYQETKLRPYLSEKYNAVVVGVAYHCIGRADGELSIPVSAWEVVFKLAPGEFQRRFLDGKIPDNIMEGLFTLLVERRITRLPPYLALQGKLADGYSSFGFLPAIEHLQVIHDVISNYSINLSEINILGTSYGGYIALLLGKYAPHTFNLIIDNSGFVATEFSEIHPATTIGTSQMKMIDGIRYEIPVTSASVWENDEFSKNYFSDAHKMIRNVCLEKHMIPNQSRYYSYHSEKDIVVPFAKKLLFCEKISEFVDVDLTLVTEEGVDGRLFKNLDHGMNASLRGLYDVTYEKDRQALAHKDETTDFHLGSTHTFHCFNKQYEFSYSLTDGINVTIS